MKILLAVDGSEHSRRAANYVAKHVSFFAQPPEVHVLHVHAPLPFPGAASAAPKGSVESYQREESEKVLAPCLKELQGSGMKVKPSWVAGDVVDEVASYVDKNGIDLIVVGSRGLGNVASVVLGSVTTKILATLQTPTLIVR